MLPNASFYGLFWIRKLESELEQKLMTFQIWREQSALRFLWTIPKASVVLGVLEVAQGPREWSPRWHVPEDFERLCQVYRGDRVSSFVFEDREYMKDLPIRSDGMIGFFLCSSPSLKELRDPHDLVVGL